MKNRNLEIVLPSEFVKALLKALKERGESLTPRLVAELEKETGTALMPLVEKTSLDSILRRIHAAIADSYIEKKSDTAPTAAPEK